MVNNDKQPRSWSSDVRANVGGHSHGLLACPSAMYERCAAHDVPTMCLESACYVPTRAHTCPLRTQTHPHAPTRTHYAPRRAHMSPVPGMCAACAHHVRGMYAACHSKPRVRPPTFARTSLPQLRDVFCSSREPGCARVGMCSVVSLSLISPSSSCVIINNKC